MKIHSLAVSTGDRLPRWQADSHQSRRPQTLSAMKARQSAQIHEIADALVTAGFVTLDEGAKALGLGRSTTWTVLKNRYKNSGISATIIDRMLSSPWLPPPVRAKITEYIEEKLVGLYGHGKAQRCRFCALLTTRLVESGHLRNFGPCDRDCCKRMRAILRGARIEVKTGPCDAGAIE